MLSARKAMGVVSGAQSCKVHASLQLPGGQDVVTMEENCNSGWSRRATTSLDAVAKKQLYIVEVSACQGGVG